MAVKEMNDMQNAFPNTYKCKVNEENITIERTLACGQ